ncbi:ABC transporter ATP-binding protein [Frankia sp. CNm7]|uniref:ABC transporter ATP-binding protein n=1 Tax=Frankia nepalensis TaxID=1836974 RepID=A0A937RDE7_9ACTN|nr:ABC transporter ATP-binding protein [Frankia nepalensis]MBL7500558.1 ABC transporter ATP-binding protein [Frankia nepalensis]MBL7509748.1 ABC transporter ATP-binding protein [Frankia nepalensis]MBL7518771.1 ABC transporter ATP-binding protein [Frankia nepalensis]MBL7627867.1 ABC transporter ATP-binding protein [Frankia nepalensis]
MTAAPSTAATSAAAPAGTAAAGGTAPAVSATAGTFTAGKPAVPAPRSPTGPGIGFAAVSKTFDAGRRGALRALDQVSFEVGGGEFVSLLGPSGCGKSTALRMVAGLEAPTGGEVRVLGRPPAEVVSEHRLGIAFQDHALLPWLDVRGNIALPFRAVGRRVDRDLVDELIELVGLTASAGLRPRELSGGMRQRVSIARSLVLRPDVLLLDEPFGALDAVTRRRLNLELQRIWAQRRITTLMVTHAVDEAVLLSDRVVVMSARPARVVDVVTVPFDRPRGLELLTDPAFHELEDRLTRALLTTAPGAAATEAAEADGPAATRAGATDADLEESS